MSLVLGRTFDSRQTICECLETHVIAKPRSNLRRAAGSLTRWKPNTRNGNHDVASRDDVTMFGVAHCCYCCFLSSFKHNNLERISGRHNLVEGVDTGVRFRPLFMSKFLDEFDSKLDPCSGIVQTSRLPTYLSYITVFSPFCSDLYLDF